jgi:hypothetical protein
LPDRCGDYEKPPRQTEDQRRRKRAKHLGEYKHDRAQEPGKDQGQRDFEERSQVSGPGHARALLQRWVHRLHDCRDHDEGDRSLEQGHHPRDAEWRVDVEEVGDADDGRKQLVQEAAFRSGEDAPCQGTHQRREIKGDLEKPFEKGFPRNIGPGQYPSQHEAATPC